MSAILRLTQTYKFPSSAVGEFGDPESGERRHYVWVTITPGLVTEEYAREVFGDFFDTALTNGLLVRVAPEQSEAS